MRVGPAASQIWHIRVTPPPSASYLGSNLTNARRNVYVIFIRIVSSDNRISVNDFHATILHLLGLDHEQLTFLHNSRDERLTDVAGRVVEEVLA